LPAARVNGNDIPLMLKPVPVTVPCATVRLLPPVLVIVSETVWLLPSNTLPKFTLAGLAERAAAATADPDRETLGAVPVAVDVMVTVPEEFPAAVGA